MSHLLTVEQTARILSVSSKQLIRLTNDGEIPFINIGRGMRKIRRYEPADIEAFKSQRKTTECQFISERITKTASIPMNSAYKVVDFQATLARSRSERRGK